MKYDEVIEAIKAGIKYKKLMADAGGGGGGAGAGGGAAGGSGGASAGGSATGTSGDGGSADGGGSDATPSADSTSSEPTSQRGGYYAGFSGYWASKGSKKKKKKKSKVGSVKDGIYEGDVIDAQDKFKQKQTKGDRFAIHIYTTDHTGRSDWISTNKYRNQYEANRHVQFQLDRGTKPEHIKVEFNGKFINMPEFGITENINNLQEEPNVEALEDKKFKLESALSSAREITRDIKYVDTHVDIVSRLGTLAEDVGIEIDEYQERQVFAAKNKLESEIYQLEEVFEDAIRDISNKIDELEYED